MAPLADADPPPTGRRSSRSHDPAFVRFLETVWGDWDAAGRTWDALPYIWPGPALPRGPSPRRSTPAWATGPSTPARPSPPAPGRPRGGRPACALAGARSLLAGGGSAFALCRPPGHHAGPCVLRWLLLPRQLGRSPPRRSCDGGAARVAVLDVDYHHGNGTQSIFWDRPDVLTVSLHADPRQEYPYFTGHVDERGAWDGEGSNRNLPMPWGTGFDVWSEALADGLPGGRRLRRRRPRGPPRRRHPRGRPDLPLPAPVARLPAHRGDDRPPSACPRCSCSKAATPPRSSASTSSTCWRASAPPLRPACSVHAPGVGLLHQLEVGEDLGGRRRRGRCGCRRSTRSSSAAGVGGHDLDQQVVAAGGDRPRTPRRSTSATASAAARTSPSIRTPIIAWRPRPSMAGSVTATICMTPRSIRRCTRWRTAACDRPTIGPSLEYGVRPSAWSARMIACRRRRARPARSYLGPLTRGLRPAPSARLASPLAVASSSFHASSEGLADDRRRSTRTPRAPTPAAGTAGSPGRPGRRPGRSGPSSSSRLDRKPADEPLALVVAERRRRSCSSRCRRSSPCRGPPSRSGGRAASSRAPRNSPSRLRTRPGRSSRLHDVEVGQGDGAAHRVAAEGDAVEERRGRLEERLGDPVATPAARRAARSRT